MNPTPATTERQTRPRPLRATRRNRGAAMSEMVLVAPFLLLFLALVIFFGRMMVQTQRAQVAARYETWRQVVGAPGPSPSDPHEVDEIRNWQINDLFFAERADAVNHFVANGAFPSLQAGGVTTPARVVGFAYDVSDPAGTLAEALMYQPQSNPLLPRFPSGREEGFTARHDVGARAMQPFVGPVRRTHALVGHEWHFTHDWRAGADLWTASSRIAPHHPRALRDVFLPQFDADLDAIDGNAQPEYPSDSTERTRTQALAGFIRSLYLQDPGYGGPIIFDENQ